MRIEFLGLFVLALQLSCSQSSFSGASKSEKPSSKNSGRDGADSSSGGSLPNGASGSDSIADKIFGTDGADGSSSGANNGGLDGANGGSSGNGTSDGANGGSSGNGTSDGANGGSSGNNNTPDGAGGAVIPDNCTNQNILIEDFKSGWWDDNGGNMYDDIIKKELAEVCRGTTTKVEFHHWQPGHGRDKFYDGNFAEYTQVWLLSGTSVGDMKVDDPAFVDLMTQIRTHKPNIFIGAGFGSLPHANALAEVVWGQAAFRSDIGPTYSVKIFEGSNNFSITSRMTNQVTGNIFQGITSPMPDQVLVTKVNILGGNAYTASDEIIPTLPNLKVLGNCDVGPYDLSNPSPRSSPPPAKASRIVPCVGVAQYNGFNVVLDSGLQRFYGMYLPAEANVRLYMRNIARALAL